jgi:natural product biosynthesis luciferase-like monooxygenase protein/amino acid adenylation domain-containing protein
MSHRSTDTLTEILRRRARRQPERTAFSFLADGEGVTARLTYAELDARARAVGALLQECGARGERVLLLFDAGLEFVTSFFGCLYAGAVAVPAPPPHPARLGRTLPRVQAIAADSRPVIALTTAALLSMIERAPEGAADLRALRWIKVDEIDPDAASRWQTPVQSAEDLAYLQYTSGSTSTPKGVMVTHFCLTHQSEHLARAYVYTPESVSATWMPNFHDYGLVEGIVHPAVFGVPGYLFSPLAFVQRPARWLEAVTRYGVTHSSGPNFAYELCVRKVSREERDALDLGSWRAAGNAAEPVHRETIERFHEKFAPCGFRREAFYPSFGLAEATLMVSAGGAEPHAPLFITAQASALEQERRVVEVEPTDAGARPLVGCGRPIMDTELAIVDPETLRRRAPDELGEIWVKCEGLARGYWQRPEETEAKFHARIADTGEGPFMRTGDLGFVRHGELFVSGRVKDLVIIRGQNYYPQDIEWTVERSHGLLRHGCCAAFSVEVGLEERLVLVQEVRREFGAADAAEVVEAIRERVAERHELHPYAVVLVKTGSINKTSSGKIQRHASRREFVEGTLEVLARWQAHEAAEVEPRLGDGAEPLSPPPAPAPTPTPTPTPAFTEKRTVEAVREWLAEKISRSVGIPPEEVDAGQPFRRYGFDSARVVALVGDLSAWLGRPLPPTLFWDYPTVEAVARHLGEEPARDSQASEVITPLARVRDAGRRAGERADEPEPIAIVGIGCRFPGADNVEAFWRLLRDGVDAVTEVPPGRWEADAHDSTRGLVRRGGFLKSVDGFDAQFFGVSPREAAQIDPQQRLLLEVAWEAIENAGYAPDRLGGTRVGVFVGISNSDYAQLQFDADGGPDAYAGTGSALSIAANRLSYLLDLRGPSMAVDTACSSSLVAVHAACQSLRAGESRLALAGGVNLLLTPKLTEALTRAGMMSADGRCKTFDAAADGYVRSEGCGVVLLKPLSEAARDGDRVLALIRGSAVNQDGRSNGLTAPNGLAQQALVREALEVARVAPSQVGYVEAHGTGTPLGDPIEFDALGAVLREGRARDARCLVGSVKTNIGHLEAAAGIAGLIKVALSLEREHVPPHLHVRELNPHLSTADSPLEIATRGRDWKRGGARRLAGVSSFGFGGTNAHVVLEEAPAVALEEAAAVLKELKEAPADAKAERPLHVLSLSAQSDGALRELARRYAEHLPLHAEQALPDVCFTANAGRARFRHRLATTCETREQLALSLRAFADAGRADGLWQSHLTGRRRSRTAFLFTGQGSQYRGMGRELYETQPSFRRALNRCDEILRPALERPLLSVLYGEAESEPRLDETAYTQPALFALGYALAELWRAWGVEPDFVFGHSVGEYAAACFAGAFTLEEGLALVAERARLMQSLPATGGMAAVFADEGRVAAAVEPYRGRVSIAAVNGPAHTVVSGEREALREVLRRLEAGGVNTRALNVSHAFHSPLMEPSMGDFERALRRVGFSPLRVPLVSGLDGAALEAGARVDADYWLSHAREPVRFDASVRTLAARGCETFVEIGPDASLLNMGRRCLHGAKTSWLPSLRRGQGDWRVLLSSLAALYVSGAEVDWESFDRDNTRRRVGLPTYPFERKSYWLADVRRRETPADTSGGYETMTTQASHTPRAEAAHAPTDPRRREAILETLRAIVGRLLQTAPETLDVHASFLEMGADSIVLVEALRVVEDNFHLKISIRQLFEQFTTLDTLAEHIEKNSTEARTAAPLPARAEAPRAATQTGPPACALPARPAQDFAAAAEATPDAPAAEVGAGPHADSLERIMTRQLDLLAQFSGLMSQQLSALGRGGSSARAALTPEAGEAHGEPRRHEPQSQTPSAESRPLPPPSSPGNGTNDDTGNGGSAPRVTTEAAHTHAAAPAHAAAGGEARAPYVPYRPVRPGAVGGLSERQRQHLSELSERFTRRTAASKQAARQYRSVLADSRAVVGFRLSIKEMLYPIVGAGADGARLRDIDGNEYVDITMGFGVHLLGHRPSFVNAAIEEQLRRGIEMGPRPALVGEVAALVCELTGMERATFCNSGTEAVMTALRLARARTGRTKVAIFAGSYHGHSDGTLARAREVGGHPLSAPLAPGIPPRVVEDVLVLDYGSPRALEILREHADELAAVLVEPVQSRHPELQPREFLHELRDWTRAAGVVLIFDEMVTGFRIHPGGAQAWFGVEADLATYGKIAGGGLPVGIVAGRAPFMDGIDGGLWEYGDASYPRAETTYFGGTFCQHPLAMASARAVLSHLKERGPSLQAGLNDRTSRLAATLNEHFAREEMPIRVAHFGSLFRFNYTGNLDLLFYHLLTKGVYVWEWRNCFLSTAHTDEDLAHVVRAVTDSAEEMRAGGFIAEKSGGPSNGGPSNGSRRPEGAGTATAGQSGGRQADGRQADGRQALGFWGRHESKPALVGAGTAAVESRAQALAHEAEPDARPNKTVRFSLSYFGNYDAAFDAHKYDLLIEGAKFADRHGFEAVWIPERHFHAFGGISPNPSVVAAALARETERIALRAGSVVLPLHHAVRVAEEWAVVDNLSRGRAGVSFASGWHPDDFVFAPEAYGRHRELMFEKIEEVRRLWRGEALGLRGGAGNEISVRLFPQPLQRELPVWVTVVNNPETYRRAGEIGAGVLTNLMGQTVEDLARNVALYRRALAEHGHDPARGHVTVLLHTLVGGDADDVRERARRPFCDYLKSSLDLFQNLVRSQGLEIDFERLSEDDMEYLLSAAYERYVRTSALVGTPDTCAPVVQSLSDIGVDEIACFIDFGVEAETVLGNLTHLDALRERYEARPATARPADACELAAPPQQSPQPPRVVRRAPTTSAQKQLWVLAQVGDGASCAYNETLCLRLRGALDVAALAVAVRAVVERHEALRTSIAVDGEEQLVHAPPPLDLPLTDLSGAATAAEREGEAARWLEEESRRKFDLGVAPLLRPHVLRLGEREHLFVLSTHHVVADGWSVGVLLEEVCAVYEAECRGVAWELGAAPLQFRDYAERRRSPESLAKSADDESFWLARLGDAPHHSDLPADRPRPPVQTYNGARLHATFEGRLCEELRALGRRHGCTLFMTLLAGHLALLHRLTGQSDVVVGIPVAGRAARDEARVVGFCTRPLPVRSRVEGDPTFAEFMTQVRGVLLEAYDHADFSALALIEKLRRPRDASRFPLFSNTFNMEPLAVPTMFGLDVGWVSPPVGHSKFDCGLNVMERGEGLQLDCDFNTDIFDAATVARVLGHLRTLLEDAARDPARRLSELELMTEAERRQVVAVWNEEARGAREFRCIHEEFEEVARRVGERVAVVCGGLRLSYAELNERAERLARRLRSLGVGPGVLVGVCAERSAEMVTGLLGVLKAGGAYVPLDPSYPLERLSFMLDDAKAHVLLTQSSLSEKFSDYWGYTICLDAEREADEGAGVDEGVDEGGARAAGAENLAYVIYTSGSTGEPKGVAVPHRAVHNLVRGTNYVRLEESDVVAQVSNASFDAATFEIWGALLAGARLVIIDKDVMLSPAEFAAQLEEHGVTVMFLTTALFNHMAGELPSAFRGLRHLLFGGEAVEPKWVGEVLEKGRPGRLLHVYGPTETTTFATFEEVAAVGERAHTVPIGRPLTNVQIYLLDERLRPVPVGVAGELCVGGSGLARGYLDRPALTAERFIPDPFSAEPGARLYRSGDSARRLPDGRIEFLGRRDGQVKIRGFRVEPGEVEALISAHPKIARAAVVAREDSPGERRLVAYVVSRSGEACGAGELRRHLGARLPEYMIPSAFVRLDELPLTPGGKVDRRQLPAPDEGRPELETKFVAPRSAVERKLAEFCSEVLGLQSVGIEDGFFELGGHSLHATQVISRVRNYFKVELPMRIFFETPTLAALARHVELSAGRGL